jgi:two-component system NtrC family sensor kinase
VGSFPDTGTDAAGRVRTFIRTDPSGRTHLYAVTRLSEKDWRLVTRIDKAVAFSAFRAAAHRITFTAMLGGLFIILAALGLTRYILARIMQLDREKDTLGRQLIRASRLAELGEMSAGFAHEVNNPLQIMKSELGLIQILWDDMPKDRLPAVPEDILQIEDCFDQLQHQLDRCGNITQGILQFARYSSPSPRDIDLCSFVPQVAAMVSKRASVNGIALAQTLPGPTLTVHGDPGQLQQVLLNLLNNAMDAVMERHGAEGGCVKIEAEKSKDEDVVLSVADNGIGISEADRKKIFSPFFTTKPAGKGTGLGLSVCYGIIEGMGGRMEFSSRHGEGSVFSIHFPAGGR